jgi:hypothetical protein
VTCKDLLNSDRKRATRLGVVMHVCNLGTWRLRQ